MTTATASRWWAPNAPGLTPDAADLDMLAASGDNPRLDLGASLIAAHRVGAAACEYAAGQPLLDERGLIECLAAARERVAPAMINSVSKSVEGPGYGALLVRDFFDDAEEASLELFRQARARGVAAPVAASRAGSVFGVAKSDLGRYRTLATDPKVNPAVLADEGDRTLFRYIEKVAKSEADERVEISKITPEERRRITAQQPRDSEGQFASLHRGLQSAALNLPQTESGDGDAGRRPPTVQTSPGTDDPSRLAALRRRLGGGGGAGPKTVGETAEEVAERERVERVRRIQEQQRTQRAQRGEQQRRTAAGQRRLVPTAKPAQPAQRQPGGQRQVGGPRSGLGVTRRVRPSLRPLEEAPTREKIVGLPLWAMPVDIGYDDAGERVVPHTQAVVMSGREASDFNKKVGARPGRLFRVNELIDDGGPNASMAGEDHEKAVASKVKGGQQPDAEMINPRTYQSMIGRTDDDIERFLIERLESENEGVPEGPPTPMKGVDGQWYALANADVYQAPHVVEFVLDGGSGLVVGHDETEWQLNPNEFYSLDFQHYGRDLYDPRGFIRTQLTARRVTESSARQEIRNAAEEDRDVGKADNHWRYQPRNEEGEWAKQAIQGIRQVEHADLHQSLREAAAQPVAPVTSDRQAQADRTREIQQRQRQQRQQRGARRATREQAPGEPVRRSAPSTRRTAGGQRRVGGQRATPETRRKMQQVSERVRATIAESHRQAHPDRHELDIVPNGTYAVLNQLDFYAMLADAGGTDPIVSSLSPQFSARPKMQQGFNNARMGLIPDEIAIFGDTRGHLDQALAPGDRAAELVADAHNVQGMGPDSEMPMAVVGDLPAADTNAIGQGRARVLDELLARPDISRITETPIPNTDMVQVRANIGRQPPVIVVELDDTLLHSSSSVLQYTGQAHVSYARMFDDGQVEQYVVPVLHYAQIPYSAFSERSYDEGE